MGDQKLSLNICLGSASVELALKKLVEDGTLKRIGTGQRLIMLMLMHMRISVLFTIYPNIIEAILVFFATWYV